MKLKKYKIIDLSKFRKDLDNFEIKYSQINLILNK